MAVESPWDFWSDNPFEGMMEVEFIDGQTRTIDVKRAVIDTQARPIYLEDVEGRLYIVQAIISVRKKT